MNNIKVYFKGQKNSGAYVQNDYVTIKKDYTMLDLISAIKLEGYKSFKTDTMKKYVNLDQSEEYILKNQYCSISEESDDLDVLRNNIIERLSDYEYNSVEYKLSFAMVNALNDSYKRCNSELVKIRTDINKLVLI